MRLGEFLITRLRTRSLDGAALCLVVAGRIVELLEPAGVRLLDLEVWARGAATIRGAPQLTGFDRPWQPLRIDSAPSEELQELAAELWAVVHEASRQEHGPDLCRCVGVLLQVAWALAGRSRAVTPDAFVNAARLAWTLCGAWMPAIEVEQREAA